MLLGGGQMYGNLARKVDDFYAESQSDMTISAGDYVESKPVPRRKLLIADDGSPAWREDAINRLDQLVNLKPDWDSYGGKPVSKRLANTVLEVLGSLMREQTPRPSIVPTPAGHIQLEWHTKQIDLEVEVASPILLRVAFEDHQTGDEWEQDLMADLSRLDQAVAILTQR
jgi:hypothetical protein